MCTKEAYLPEIENQLRNFCRLLLTSLQTSWAQIRVWHRLSLGSIRFNGLIVFLIDFFFKKKRLFRKKSAGKKKNMKKMSSMQVPIIYNIKTNLNPMYLNLT